MGWTFYRKPFGKPAVESIKEEFGADWVAKHVVASSATREAVFLVVKRHDPNSDVYVPDADGNTRELAVIKIKSIPKARDGYNFGYKDMTETMGPVGCEAPLSILDQCSPLKPKPGPHSEGQWYWSPLRSAHEYRERCKAKAAAMAFKRGLKPGATVKLAKPLSFAGQMLDTFTVVRTRVRGRKGISTVFSAVPSGMLCGITAENLIGATIPEDDAAEELAGINSVADRI